MLRVAGRVAVALLRAKLPAGDDASDALLNMLRQQK